MASSTSMAPIIFLVLCLSFSFSLHHVVVEGAGRYFSTKQQDEDLELEKQLKILNKPPVKTIQTKEGDTFDCIDIHSQPAFDNPLLKNHKIQMPKSPSKELSPSANSLSKILKRIDCPQGTVPIRRTSKEDLIRAKYFSQPKSFHLLSSEHPGEHKSYMISNNNTGTFYGARGNINIASPTVGNNQYSGAQIWVGGGDSGGEFNTIQAGWGVSPSLFGDSQTRLIVYWNADALHKEGCYNLLCSGFVQVDQQYPVGTVITTVSQFQGKQYVLPITIYQDKNSGDWWLQAGDEEKKIGYWPKSLFNHLSNGASQVLWGGIVKGTSYGPSPQMGNGHYPNQNYNEACSVTNMGVQKDSHDYWSFNENDFQFKLDGGLVSCYNIEYDGEITQSQGYSFLFGGPGGNNCGV